jgi:hypothetical protein
MAAGAVGAALRYQPIYAAELQRQPAAATNNDRGGTRDARTVPGDD